MKTSFIFLVVVFAVFGCAGPKIDDRVIGAVPEPAPVVPPNQPAAIQPRSPKPANQLKPLITTPPPNELAVAKWISGCVKNGKYQEAVDYYPQLLALRFSGVGYSAYPDVALAFDRLGQSKRSIEILDELHDAIAEAFAKGSGFLCHAGALRPIEELLQRNYAVSKDVAVKNKTADLLDYVRSALLSPL
jgi:tetratricopeptide (TPR) repeat protein